MYTNEHTYVHTQECANLFQGLGGVGARDFAVKATEDVADEDVLHASATQAAFPHTAALVLSGARLCDHIIFFNLTPAQSQCRPKT
jgi:hypothetical protein